MVQFGMKIRRLRAVGLLVMGAVLILSFQNCSKAMKTNGGMDSTVRTPASFHSSEMLQSTSFSGSPMESLPTRVGDGTEARLVRPIFIVPSANANPSSAEVTIDTLETVTVFDENQSGPAPLSSLVYSFAGGDPNLRQRFVDFARPYTAGFGSNEKSHPLCSGRGGRTRFASLQKPYQVYHSKFYNWVRTNWGIQDFMSPQSRKWNDYLGDGQCPMENGNTLDLRTTWGQRYNLTDQAITVEIDNKYNPWRWFVPVRPMVHHEAPSTFVLTKLTSQEYGQTASALKDYYSGANRDREVILEYEIDLDVIYQSAMNENSVEDISLSSDQSVRNLYAYTMGFYNSLSSPGGSIMGVGFKQIWDVPLLKGYYEKRFRVPTFNMGIGVDMSSSNAYRVADFNLVQQNYEIADDPNWIRPTNNAEINPYIREGGVSDAPTVGSRMGWLRLRTSGIRLFADRAPLDNPFISGSDFSEIPPGQSFNRKLKGKISLSKFYKLSRDNGFFPGQKGFWFGSFRGFCPECAENPPGYTEEHGVREIGVGFEAHGPYKVKMAIKQLKLSFEDKVQAAIPGPAANCSVASTGIHNTIGLASGDSRFLCFNNRWYDCGWELNDPSWETKVAGGQQIGSYTCDLTRSKWKPVSGVNGNANCSLASTGTHNTVGLASGDPRFLCFNNRWYDCGWELNDPSWETKVPQSTRVGSHYCELGQARWKPVGETLVNQDSAGTANCELASPGFHNVLGTSNGDTRFLCYNNRWYDCGWELNDPSWETKVSKGASVGGYICDGGAQAWVSAVNGHACGAALSGTHGKTGYTGGATDIRFLCFNSRWYDCGWEGNDQRWETKVTAGKSLGGYTCSNGGGWR